MTNVLTILGGIGRLWQAATWRVRATEKPSIQISEEFRAWRTNAGNRDAYIQIEHAWDALEEQKMAPEILALRRQALERARAEADRPRHRSIGINVAAVAAILLIGAFAIENLSTKSQPVIYATGIGERKTVLLSDGSRMALDASSSVVVRRFSRHSRELALMKGRARFDVAHDKSRPFTVTAGREVTLAVGTSFDVESLKSSVVVTLREGRVLVKASPDAGARHPPMTLNPGQALMATRDGHATIQKVNLQAASAWESGRIVLNDQEIGDAVQQFNRYLDRPIMVDAAVAHMRISGVFKLEDAKSFVGALTSYLPIQSRIAANNQIYLEKRAR